MCVISSFERPWLYLYVFFSGRFQRRRGRERKSNKSLVFFHVTIRKSIIYVAWQLWELTPFNDIWFQKLWELIKQWVDVLQRIQRFQLQLNALRQPIDKCSPLLNGVELLRGIHTQHNSRMNRTKFKIQTSLKNNANTCKRKNMLKKHSGIFPIVSFCIPIAKHAVINASANRVKVHIETKNKKTHNAKCLISVCNRVMWVYVKRYWCNSICSPHSYLINVEMKKKSNCWWPGKNIRMYTHKFPRKMTEMRSKPAK